MKLTVRNVPPKLDRALREEARSQGKSVDEVVIEVLQRTFGVDGEPIVQRDLSDIVGTWQDDPELESILAEQRRVSPKVWE